MNSGPGKLPPRLFPWLLPAALGTLTLLFYARCVTFDFTNWDDQPLLTENPLTAPFAWRNIFALLHPRAVPQEHLYIPVTYLSHLFENAWLGVDARVTHGVNVVLHTVNVLLLYRLVRRLDGGPLAAAVAGLLFAFHPLQVEAVAWSMGRKDLLAAGFALLSLLAWRRWLEQQKLPAYFAALAAYVLACLAKPSMLIVPGLLALLAGRQAAWRRERLKFLLPFLLPFAAILLVNLGLRRGPGELPPLGFRLACIPWLAEGWLLRLLLIRRPIPFYPWPTVGVGRLLVTGVPLVAAYLAALAFAVRRRRRATWFGLAFFAVAFSPAAGVVLDYRKFVTADRYGYFPLIGLFIVVAVWAEHAFAWRRWTMLPLAAVLLLSGVSAWRQAGAWRNSTTLWTTVIERGVENKFVWLSLGEAQQREGRLTSAIRAYRNALALDPEFAIGWRDLGGALLQAGRYEEAIAASRKARHDPEQWPKALQNIGAAHFARREFPQALAAFEAQLRYQPDQPVVHLYAARTCALLAAAEQSGYARRGIDHARRAIQLDSNMEEAYFVLAGLLSRRGERQAAEAVLQQLRAVNPGSKYLERFRQVFP